MVKKIIISIVILILLTLTVLGQATNDAQITLTKAEIDTLTAKGLQLNKLSVSETKCYSNILCIAKIEQDMTGNLFPFKKTVSLIIFRIDKTDTSKEILAKRDLKITSKLRQMAKTPLPKIPVTAVGGNLTIR